MSAEKEKKKMNVVRRGAAKKPYAVHTRRSPTPPHPGAPATGLFYRGEKFNYKKVLAFRQFGLVAIYRSNSRTPPFSPPLLRRSAVHPRNPSLSTVLSFKPSESCSLWPGYLRFIRASASNRTPPPPSRSLSLFLVANHPLLLFFYTPFFF